MQTVSVIIPTLNEVAFLPALLNALHSQTRPPDEIIVADAGSTDGTTEAAKAHGARVVPGGMPGPGRNAGARAAHGDLFLFFDADVLPHPDFIERAVEEFTSTGYVVATCPTEALSHDLTDKVIVQATNLYLQIIQPISPRAPGFCILAQREVHQAINGFDESLKLSEDHDYVRRASQHGEFGVLTSVRIPVSMRRLEKEGMVGLALKYLWCEMYALAGKPVRSTPFEYEFGAFQPTTTSKGQPLIDIAELRAQLGRFENPIQRLSQTGLEQLHRLVEFDPLDATLERVRLLLERNDVDTLDDYLQKRLTLIREHRLVNWSLEKLKTLPDESIRLLEPNWLRPLAFKDVQPEEKKDNA
ncbi:MAG: glycosyltransferase [Chloroflexi bacterium]|nr:glycosyltransferase [Chloroflexota bacterium]